MGLFKSKRRKALDRKTAKHQKQVLQGKAIRSAKKQIALFDEKLEQIEKKQQEYLERARKALQSNDYSQYQDIKFGIKQLVFKKKLLNKQRTRIDMSIERQDFDSILSEANETLNRIESIAQENISKTTVKNTKKASKKHLANQARSNEHLTQTMEDENGTPLGPDTISDEEVEMLMEMNAITAPDSDQAIDERIKRIESKYPEETQKSDQKESLSKDEHFHELYQTAINLVREENYKTAKKTFYQASKTLYEKAKDADKHERLKTVRKADNLLKHADQLVSDDEEKKNTEKTIKTSTSEPQPNDSEIQPRTKLTGITLDDVAGLDHIKQYVRERIIMPFERPELFEKFDIQPGGGLLMYGLPGTGKTMFAEAVANEIDAAYFVINSREILSKYPGTAERRIHNYFQVARQYDRSILFFDEFDSIGSKRSGSNSYMNRIINEMLQAMQGIGESNKGMLIIAATNRPNILDPALLRPGRFDRKVHISLPDQEARKHILENNLKDIPKEQIDLDWIAQELDGANGADIKEFCQQLKRMAINRISEDEIDEPAILPEDVEQILKTFSISVSKEDIRNLQDFEDTFK